MNITKIVVSSILLFQASTIFSANLDFVSTEDSISKKIELIRNASKNSKIYMMYYIFNNDSAGKAVTKALIQAKRDRDVEVKIIFDDMGPGPNFPNLGNLGHVIESEGMEVKLFNDSVFSIANRMHDKLLIVDNPGNANDQVMIGSSNIWNAADARTFIQSDVVIEDSAVVNDALEHFELFWNSSKVSSIPRAKKKFDLEDTLFQVNRFGKRSRRSNMTPMNKGKFDVHSVEYFYDHPRKDSKSGSTQKVVDLIRSANERIDIVNTYVILTTKLKKALKAAAKKGIEINIYTNTPKVVGSELPLIADGYNSIFGDLVDMKVNLYELNRGQLNHSKFMIVDNDSLLLSSFNFDNLSTEKNTENGIIVSNLKDQKSFLNFLKQRINIYKTNSNLVIDNGITSEKRGSFTGNFKAFFTKQWL